MIPIPMTVQFEQNLSAYNIYEGNLNDLRPTSDFHLYELGAALFSNYAKKQRLIKLPEGTTVTKNATGELEYPEGSIMVKTFYYFLDERDESLGKLVVETRLLIKSQGQWNVGTYVWNEDQTDARLELNGFDTTLSWIDAEGTNRAIWYHFPDQNECVSCHQRNEEVLYIGPTLRNLNIEVTRENETINQLKHLQAIGIFSDFDVSQVEAIPDYNDLDVSLSERGRAYLEMNCAHCHNPAGWSESSDRRFDFRYETPINNTGIFELENKAKIWRVMEDRRMPYLGVTTVDQEGLELITQFVNGL